MSSRKQESNLVTKNGPDVFEYWRTEKWQFDDIQLSRSFQCGFELQFDERFNQFEVFSPADFTCIVESVYVKE